MNKSIVSFVKTFRFTLLFLLAFILFSCAFLFIPSGADLISAQGDAMVGGVLGNLFGMSLVIEAALYFYKKQKNKGTK